MSFFFSVDPLGHWPIPQFHCSTEKTTKFPWHRNLKRLWLFHLKGQKPSFFSLCRVNFIAQCWRLCTQNFFFSFLTCLELLAVGLPAVLALKSAQTYRCAWTLSKGQRNESSFFLLPFASACSQFVALWCYVFTCWVKSHSNGFLQRLKQKDGISPNCQTVWICILQRWRGCTDYSTEGLVLQVQKRAHLLLA